ncbi:hypothetical protein BGX34_000562 [Mortierella sp. NVP85]|nr:hypothetical protein BGX34_000562 [Mortierella sp. NVP85]
MRKSMAPTHPLEIQEIKDLVVSYLGRNDLTQCLRVSKNWRSMFLPYIWRIVRTGLYQGPRGTYCVSGPTWDAIDNHRHAIEELTLVNMSDGFNKYQYPNLRRLVIDMSFSKAQHSQLFMNFTTKTPMLVDLELKGGYLPSVFWIALMEHPHLRHLSLTNLTIGIYDEPRLWRTCMKLESLDLYMVVLQKTSRPLGNMMFGRLRRLMFKTTLYPYFLEIAVRSPMLESLEWNVYNYWSSLQPPTVAGNWSHLKKVYLPGWDEDANMDLLFKRVENGLGNMADVEEPYRSGSDTRVSKAFGSHFSTLVDMDLRAAKKMSRSTVPDILCFCPRLKKLLAASVSARSVAERGPWACQHLQELQIQFAFEKGEDHLKPLMFERLSTLVQLERLTLDYRFTDGNRDVGMLECQLGRGLGQLARLQQLRHIWFYTSFSNSRYPHLGMEEVEWILKNWGQLEKIQGDLTDNIELRAQLRRAFKSNGIRAVT